MKHVADLSDSEITLFWFTIRLSWSVILCATLTIFLFQSNQNFYPEGIFRFVPMSFSLPVWMKVLASIIINGCGVLYVLNRNMKLVVTVLAVLSFFVVSYHEANGIYARATILTAICIGQAIAFYQNERNYPNSVAYKAINYSVQMIAAGYVLAGISKIYESGLGWFLDVEGFCLQIMKNFYFLYADTGNSEYLNYAQSIYNIFSNYPWVPAAMLFAALLLELFCFVVVYMPKLTVWWGIGLLLMHLGIAVLMGIGISVIAFPMVIFFINPVYYIIRGIKKLSECNVV
ncbi:MAG: hypothetical protein RML37_00210 [Chitinophagales bacterium]|nr:hypothetical protein [Chitinophagales bacterium]